MNYHELPQYKLGEISYPSYSLVSWTIKFVVLTCNMSLSLLLLMSNLPFDYCSFLYLFIESQNRLSASL